MTTVAPTTATFDSLDPATGLVVSTHPIHDTGHVNAVVDRARIEASWWESLGFGGRKERLIRWQKYVVQHMDELVDLMHRENGKPAGDAALEITLAIDHLHWAATHAAKVLKRRSVAPGLIMANNAATVAYRPFGVVAVIGPWNYPVFTPMGSIAYALAAGNAVVFKPSEHTPGIGEWLARSFLEAIGRPVLQVVTGFGETGSALCAAGVGKVAFTGSPATARRVMAACAETLTPVLMEAGGKDALIVDEDAELDAAADATIWGATSNAGQTCAGVERVYVHERVYDDFVRELTDRAKGLAAEPGGQLGPITMPSQIDIIRRHIDHAIACGGRAVVGGPDAVGDRYVQPTVLVDVPDDCPAVTEETFGPTVTVTKVRDMDEAVAKANATAYGLGSTVFGKARAVAVAERLRAGMTSINAILAFAGVPGLPFGGVGESGFGRIHGPDGLKEFTYSHAITRQRFKPALAMTTFRRTTKDEERAGKLVNALYGRSSKKDR